MRIYDYESKNKEKGITLIALVITIVILLILAAVSINAVLGDNGIVKKATEAKNQYSNADVQEKENMDELLESMEEIEAGEVNNNFIIYPQGGTSDNIIPDNLSSECSYGNIGNLNFHNDEGYFSISTPGYTQYVCVYTKDTIDLSQYNSIIVKKTSELLSSKCTFAQDPASTNYEGYKPSLTYTSLGGDYANFYIADLSNETRSDLKFFLSSYGSTRNDGDYYLIMLSDKTVAEVTASHRFLKKYNK